jgi:Di-haem oxidoreductase, putative peroxidase
MARMKFLICYLPLLFASRSDAQEFRPEIPRAWDDKAVEGFEVPLAQRDRSPRYMSADEYYKLKVRPIYRSYPVYAKGREPAGYLESLKQKEPEIIFDASKLHTKQDWIDAGKLVFETEIRFFPAPEAPAAADVPLVFGGVGKDGQLPYYRAGWRYYIREKGVVEGGINACVGCHTRRQPDGSAIEGAQGTIDLPLTETQLRNLREMTPEVLARRINVIWTIFGAPWIMSRAEFEAHYTKEEYARLSAVTHPNVFRRQGTSLSDPPHVPSLIGVQDRKYLDSTGISRNRSIGDLMRYAITNQGLDTLAFYGDFQPPAAGRRAFSGDEGTRYSDEQLYALALYIESLRPPPNPNPFDDRARRGQAIFTRQGCAGCHPPPFYTNNKLTPAVGFQVPDDLRKTDDIMDVSVGTDPTLAMKTRRGTGFYKVPSLMGVWYRNAFGHSGGADTLEEWFDPARLKSDYIPKGFHIDGGPIQGHEFGLKLAAEDKAALIAFLKTL